MTDRPTRRQLRRHARRLRRDGFQPMIVLNSGDQIPRDRRRPSRPRHMRRYRSELTPLVIAALVYCSPPWPCTTPTTDHGHGWRSSR